MAEVEKLIIAMKNLRKGYSNEVLEPDALAVINHMLMNKTIVQNPEESRFWLFNFFTIVELIAETKY